MKRKDIILALLVVIVWGANFTVIKLGINGLPSMVLAALRYAFVIPAAFFIKPPKMDMKYLVAYGLSVGVGQFACLFYAMGVGMPAGLSSIVLQSAAFLTPVFAFMALKESIRVRQMLGLTIAGVGLYIIGLSIKGDNAASIPLPALLLTLLAASFWAISNIVLKFASNKAQEKDEKLDMLSVVVYSSMVPPIPLFMMAFLFDSPQTIFNSLMNLNMVSIFSVLYLALLATIFGYGTWSILLGKYPASYVAPLSLLVPITGLITAQIVLKEKLTPMQWMGGGVILIGLILSNIDFAALKSLKKGFGENCETDME